MTIEDLWKKLGTIPVQKDETIELPFLHFPVGTHREPVWLWFEDTFNISVYNLMFPKDSQPLAK